MPAAAACPLLSSLPANGGRDRPSSRATQLANSIQIYTARPSIRPRSSPQLQAGRLRSPASGTARGRPHGGQCQACTSRCPMPSARALLPNGLRLLRQAFHLLSLLRTDGPHDNSACLAVLYRVTAATSSVVLTTGKGGFQLLQQGLQHAPSQEGVLAGWLSSHQAQQAA